MDLYLWFIFASVLLVSADAGRYDKGPQSFVDSAPLTFNNEQKYETKEVVLYLTPSQVKALEDGGAVVRPKSNEFGITVDIPAEHEEDFKQSIDQEESLPENLNKEEQEQKQVSELEEIFRILNEQIDEEQNKRKLSSNDEIRPVVEEQFEQQGIEQEEQQETEQVEGQDEQEQEEEQEEDEEEEEQVEEDQEEDEEEEQESEDEEAETEEGEGEEEIEIPRRIPVRFRSVSKQREVKYLGSSVATKEKRTRSQSSGQPKKSTLRPRQKNSQTAEGKKNKTKQDAESPEKKPKVFVTESQQDPAQKERQAQPTNVENTQDKLAALLTPLLNNDRIVQSITQHRGRLVQSELELQTALRQLKEAPKYNDQKYAIEVEKLKANLEKQNALSRAVVLAKTRPALIKEDLKKRRLVEVVQPQSVLSAAYTLKASQPYTVPLHYVRPVSVPFAKSENLEIQKPVTFNVEERVPVHVAKNVYYKLNKPYVVERIVPVGKKEVATALPVRKPERLTILRHLWEH